jgi:hypothetical protein
MTKTRRQLEREVDQLLGGRGSEGGGGTRFGDDEIEQMFRRRGDDADSTKIAILGDPMYVRRFKMAKWNIKPSVLDTADVAIRHHGELGIPTSKHAHRLRADYLRALRGRFEAEHRRLLAEAERKYGQNGPMISAGLRDDWPSIVKDRIRFVAQGASTIGRAVQLHEALSKTRSPRGSQR